MNGPAFCVPICKQIGVIFGEKKIDLKTDRILFGRARLRAASTFSRVLVRF
jgi:hypothetical protein